MGLMDQTTLEHVRLRRAQVEASVARLRLSHLLAPLSLLPAAMPPSAVLLVRAMGDPLPGGITRVFGPDPRASTEWELAARSQLGTLYRGAARPALDGLTSSVEAVLFADDGELLAWLALDPAAADRTSWWWKSIQRHFSLQSSGAWVEAWIEHAIYVPSALRLLHEQGRAVQVLERRTPAEAWRVMRAVARAYTMPESTLVAASERAMLQSKSPTEGPARAWKRPQPRAESETTPDLGIFATTIPADDYEQPGLPADDSNAEAAAQMSAEREAWPDYAGRTVKPPWEPYIGTGSIPIGLGLAQRCLLGISLLLHRAPQLASSVAFHLRLRSWLAMELERENRSAGTDAAPSQVRTRIEVRKTPSVNAEAAPSQPIVFDSPDEPLRAEPPLRKQNAPVPMSALDAPPDAAPVPTDAPMLPGSTVEDTLQQSLQLENGWHTGVGGVLYLIHLLRRCDLMSFDCGLGSWALLELLARCLLDQTFTAVCDDPIWGVLAKLDGREPGTHLGVCFQPQRIYEAPESWLRDLDSSMQYVRFRSSRVEVWHPEGFLTLDSQDRTLPHDSGASRFTRLDRRQRTLRSAAKVRTLNFPLPPELRRFLHFLLPFARWRLRQALPNANLQEILLRDGTLYITRTHIDLVMGMQQISVPARLAGLDANPGWVPELGRIIAFHFIQDDPGGLRL
jgi:hypothetical protein